MAYLHLSGVGIDFPVFSSRSRGALNTLLGKAAGGGRFGHDGGGQLHVQALRDIDLRLEDGDRVGLIGANGSGKSTLLRVLSGVYEPTEGRMHGQGRIASLTDLMLGMDPDASGYDFIMMRGLVTGLRKQQIQALVPDVAAFTELDAYLHLPVRTYSSGMLLRLAFAVSTATVPDILLMDELIGVGDAPFLERALQRLRAMMQQAKVFVLASHVDSILQAFCNKGLVLARGRIVFRGNIEACLAHYHQMR